MNEIKWFLVVDDDADTREIIANDILENLPYKSKIIQAKDGVEASSKLNVQAFDCILTDLNMPRRDGRAFIEWIKKCPLNASTPLVVVTGFRDPELERNYEMLRVLEKPYDKADLVEVLETQIKLGRLDERLGASVLNTLIEISMLFVKKVLNTQAKQNPAEAKSSSTKMKGDVVCTMKIKTLEGSFRLALGFEAAVLEEMKVAINASKDLKDYQLVESALNVIFTLTQKMFSHNYGTVPILEEKNVFTDANTFEFKEISKCKGIIIPMESEKGLIYAHALYAKSSSIKKVA